MLEPAKSQVGWRSRDEVLVGTDFDGDGECLTDSGYPRVCRSWKRGTPLSEAKTVFEGEKSDISASQYAYTDHGVAHEFRVRSLTFYTATCGVEINCICSMAWRFTKVSAIILSIT